MLQPRNSDYQLGFDFSKPAKSKDLLAFTYSGELYIRCIPVKALFRSSLIHEVVNRGDIFAIRVRDQALTIISGTTVVQHVTLAVDPATAVTVPVIPASDTASRNNEPC